MRAIVYTDGACLGNGTRNAQAGFGIFWPNKQRYNLYGPLPANQKQTNNRAEYMAVLVAIKQAIDYGYDKVIIRTDSNLLIQSLDEYIEKWEDNGWLTSYGNPVKNQDLIREIDDLREHEIDVEFEHVRGHTRNYGNEKADEMAKDGADGDEDPRGNYRSYYDYIQSLVYMF